MLAVTRESVSYMKDSCTPLLPASLSASPAAAAAYCTRPFCAPTMPRERLAAVGLQLRASARQASRTSLNGDPSAPRPPPARTPATDCRAALPGQLTPLCTLRQSVLRRRNRHGRTRAVPLRHNRAVDGAQAPAGGLAAEGGAGGAVQSPRGRQGRRWAPSSRLNHVPRS